MRVAYIGLSYPTFYDYLHLAKKTDNDLGSSPNPIIESPWGLMILYDELWFLCESLCPNNMRNLSYVKFVDKMFPDLYFEGAKDYIKEVNIEVESEEFISYEKIMNSMYLNDRIRKGLDIHTHEIKVGSIFVYAKDDIRNFSFDLYILEALKERTIHNVNLISNSLHYKHTNGLCKDIEVVQQILISDIPNYISANGPYHECIEELRNHKYLLDFRKWINENQRLIQDMEIMEMRKYVQYTIDDTKEKIFRRYLEDNNNYNMFKSTSKTLIYTALGIPFVPVSLYSAGKEIISKGKEVVQAKNVKWQGFITDAQRIVSDR